MLIFSVCLLWAQRAENPKQQQEPSLAETEKWITQTFGDGRHIVFKGFQEIDFALADIKRDNFDDPRCYMQFSVIDQVDINHLLDPPAGNGLRFLQLIDLADIDPSSIKSGELIHDTDFMTSKDPNLVPDSTGAVKDHPYVFVTIKTTDNKNSIINYTYWTENGESTKYREMEHLVGFPGIAVEPEYAPRFMKALRHAVELCGGKPSTF